MWAQAGSVGCQLLQPAAASPQRNSPWSKSPGSDKYVVRSAASGLIKTHQPESTDVCIIAVERKEKNKLWEITYFPPPHIYKYILSCFQMYSSLQFNHHWFLFKTCWFQRSCDVNGIAATQLGGKNRAWHGRGTPPQMSVKRKIYFQNTHLPAARSQWQHLVHQLWGLKTQHSHHQVVHGNNRVIYCIFDKHVIHICHIELCSAVSQWMHKYTNTIEYK